MLHLAVEVFEALAAAVHRCHFFMPSRWVRAIATIFAACAERPSGPSDSGASGLDLPCSRGLAELAELAVDGP